MDAETALKNNHIVNRFQNIKTITLKKSEKFKIENEYTPPYWQLVKFAEESLNQ